jgi:hypothetical protein
LRFNQFSNIMLSFSVAGALASQPGKTRYAKDAGVAVAE